MIYRCPACKQNLRRDGRLGKTIKSYCSLNGKNVRLRKVTKKAKVKRAMPILTSVFADRSIL